MNRTVTIKKEDLLEALKVNKAAHIKDYNEAVIAYKKEGLKQLLKLKLRIEGGALDIMLNLVTPIDNSDTYDENIKLFEWEVNDEVELTKDEFDELVLDKSHYTTQAYFSNSTYR
jgi:hypothetical protein